MGCNDKSFKMPSRIASPFSGAVTRQPHLEIKFCLIWTIKSEQSKITNVLCLILLRHVIFWKPCQIPLFQQNLAQNLDYQSASSIRPHKHSCSPSRVLIHFYPALFRIPPGRVLGIHTWQMIWWDSNKTWMNSYFSVRQKVWLVKKKKKRYITICWNQSAENDQQWDQLGKQDWLSPDLLLHFSQLPSWQQNPPLLEFHWQTKKQNSKTSWDINSLKSRNFFLILSKSRSSYILFQKIHLLFSKF